MFTKEEEGSHSDCLTTEGERKKGKKEKKRARGLGIENPGDV